jgi:viroplasmin and RNaseH domain-containing protein
MPDSAMIWNLILTGGCGALVWWIKTITSQVTETRKLVSITREELAKYYALKVDVERDIDKIMVRFDRLENKLDSLIERTHK